MTVQAFQPRAQPCFQCPFDWIRYRGKCYYFSEAEGNWTSSQDNCSALGASLAMLDSMEDLVRKHDDLLSMGGKTQKQCIWNLLVSLIALTGSFLNIWDEKLGKRPWGYVNMGVFKLPTKGNCCKKCRNKPLFLGDTSWKEIEMVKPQRSPKQHEKLVNLWFFFFAWKKGKTFPFPLFQSFVMRYKGISEHWIGLLREDEEQPWQWVNRSPLSHLWVHVFHYYVVGWCFLSHKMCISSSTWGTSRGSNGKMFG